MNIITQRVIASAEAGNADFQAKLTPTLPRELFLGVRTPRLREIEKDFRGTEAAAEFLRALPHGYYDESLLHSIFISCMKDYGAVLEALDAFLPYVDSWAVCDALRPAVFKTRKDGLMDRVRGWIASDAVYTCRFGMGVLTAYYLDGDFSPEQLELCARVHSDEYYVNMMAAWYFATALAKQWEAAVPYIEERRLDVWVHNKTIQKARESFRITPEQKEYLNTLKIR